MRSELPSPCRAATCAAEAAAVPLSPLHYGQRGLALASLP